MDDQAETTTQAEKPVVIITGASAGIGEAAARRFAKAGWRIVAVARGQDRLEQLASSLGDVTDVAILAADVTHADVADRAVDTAIKTFGRLDCLVNNAGSGIWAAVHETTDAMLDEEIETSLKAPFRFCRAALRVMKPGSSIVNISSTWGLVGGMSGGAYCAAKAGLTGLTQTLAADYGAKGIRSNCIAPGVVRTAMTDKIWDTSYFQRINQEMTPFDRDGTVEDVANAIFFLASPEGSYFNGQTLALDGGWSTTKYLTYEALVGDRGARKTGP